MSKNGNHQLAKSSTRMVRGFFHQYSKVFTSDLPLSTLKNDNAKNSREEGDEKYDEVLMEESRHSIRSEKPTFESNRWDHQTELASVCHSPSMKQNWN